MPAGPPGGPAPSVGSIPTEKGWPTSMDASPRNSGGLNPRKWPSLPVAAGQDAACPPQRLLELGQAARRLDLEEHLVDLALHPRQHSAPVVARGPRRGRLGLFLRGMLPVRLRRAPTSSRLTGGTPLPRGGGSFGCPGAL